MRRRGGEASAVRGEANGSGDQRHPRSRGTRSCDVALPPQAAHGRILRRSRLLRAGATSSSDDPAVPGQRCDHVFDLAVLTGQFQRHLLFQCHRPLYRESHIKFASCSAARVRWLNASKAFLCPPKTPRLGKQCLCVHQAFSKRCPRQPQTSVRCHRQRQVSRQYHAGLYIFL